MVDKLNRTESVSATSVGRYKKAASSDKVEPPKLSRTLINEIISEIRQEKGAVSAQAVQHKVIVKSLMANFGFAASTEPKFKKLYNHINDAMSKDEQAQKLLQQAIERYS